jgi:hypothetical protein
MMDGGDEGEMYGEGPSIFLADLFSTFFGVFRQGSCYYKGKR